MIMRAFAATMLITLSSGPLCAESTDNPPAFEAADVGIGPGGERQAL